MQRINFYKLNLKYSFENFKQALITSPSSLIDGYIFVHDVRDKVIHASFHKKVVITDRIKNPNGDYEQIEYYVYQNIEFFIFTENDLINLAILDQPKSIKFFLSFLKKSDSLFFSIDNHHIDINSKVINEANSKIIKVKFSNLHLSKNSYADIEILSNLNALADAKTLHISENSKIHRIKLIEHYHNLFFETEFNDKASFSIKIDRIDFNIIHFLFEKYIKRGSLS